MPTSNNIATFVTVLCLSWLWLFVLLGGTQFGRERFYFPLARQVFGDEFYQGGLVLLTLVLPILLAGTVASLLYVSQDKKARRTVSSTNNNNSIQLQTTPPPLSCCCCCSHGRQKSTSSSSSWSATAVIFCWLVLPCGFYVASAVNRKMLKAPNTSGEDRTSFVMMITANSFAFMSLLAMSWLLIPVARQSSLLMLLPWWFDVSPIQAIQYIHVTSGYLVLVGVLIHSVLHLWRWNIMGELWRDMLLPPAFCWWSINQDEQQSQPQQQEPLCYNPDSDCSCYHHFRNLTGVLGFLAFGLLASTAVWPIIRRRWYALFYLTHIIAGPMAILMTVLHYPRAILYVAPSLLYYIATSFPNMMEMRRQQQQQTLPCCSYGCCCNGKRSQGVRIISVQEIASGPSRLSSLSSSTAAAVVSQRTIVSLRVEASPEALRRFRPGQYVKLSCPDISSLAHHPFTINTVPDGNNNILAIHFRVCGSFTTQLAALLLASTLSSSASSSHSLPPAVYLNGFFGSTHRLAQVLQHDVTVFVAGGIGITPYLSLLQELMVDAMSPQDENDDCESSNVAHVQGHKPRVVVLHWICREESFVEYVKEEYFKPLLHLQQQQQQEVDGSSSESSVATSSKLTIRLVVHRTYKPSPANSSYTDLEHGNHQQQSDDVNGKNINGNAKSLKQSSLCENHHHHGVPFTPSMFAVGASGSGGGIRGNLLPFVSFSLIAWLGLAIIWYQYTHVIQPTAEERVFNRVWSLVGIVALGWIVSWLVNVWAPGQHHHHYQQQQQQYNYKPHPHRRLTRRGILWDRVKSHGSDNEDNDELNEEGACVEDVELSPLSTITDDDELNKPNIVLPKNALSGSTIIDSSESNNIRCCNDISVEDVVGRPSVHELLRALDGAHSPGLFVCGPTSLMQEIRQAAQERCLLRMRHCTRGTPHIALYEEAFEM